MQVWCDCIYFEITSRKIYLTGNRDLATWLRRPNVLDDNTRENKSKKVMEWSSKKQGMLLMKLKNLNLN
jgi:hypothetical protein